MIVEHLRRLPRVEVVSGALDQARTRALCDALKPTIGRPSYADVMQRPDPDYRVLKWCRRHDWSDDAIRVILRSFPSGAFALNFAGLRVVVGRDVERSAWQSFTAHDRVAAAAKARATRARNAARNGRRLYSWPLADAPDTLGWRVWAWDGFSLRSPYRNTPWPEDGVLEAEEWSDDGALRGAVGIHAVRLPVDWERADPSWNTELCPCEVDGIVERFGRAVVGDAGWRAERVVIRRIRAPSTRVGLEIERRYPTVEVFYPPELEA